MAGKYLRDLVSASSVVAQTLVAVSEETTEQSYKTTVSNLTDSLPYTKLRWAVGAKISSTHEWIHDTSYHTIPYDQVLYDFGSNWHLAPYRFDVTQTGIYSVSFTSSIVHPIGGPTTGELISYCVRVTSPEVRYYMNYDSYDWLAGLLHTNGWTICVNCTAGQSIDVQYSSPPPPIGIEETPDSKLYITYMGTP